MFQYTSSVPGRYYCYGAPFGPTENLAIVAEQMRLGHDYRNSLVGLERARRDFVNRTIARMFPDLSAVESDIDELGYYLDLVDERIRVTNARKRSRRGVPPELKKEKSELLARLKPLRERRTELRYGPIVRYETLKTGKRKPIREGGYFSTPQWNAANVAIEAENAMHLELRKAAFSRLYWGTQNAVVASIDRSGPPPAFHEWHGDGHITVQIQARGGRGSGKDRIPGKNMTVPDAFSGRSSFLRLDPVDPTVKKPKTVVHIRIQSDEERNPVWASLPIVLHRPMPSDAQIRYVHIVRRRVATRYRWEVLFNLARESGWDKPDRATSGVVGIDIGYRLIDGQLRIAYWRGDDGREGELFLPGAKHGRIWKKGDNAGLLKPVIPWHVANNKVAELRSIQDKEFDAVKETLDAWLSSRTGELPAFLEATTTLSAWKSHERLRTLFESWRNNRFDGDSMVFDRLEAWYRQSRHLYQWERNQEENLAARRKDYVRNFVAMIRRSYAVAKVEALDLRDFHVKPAPGEEPKDGEGAKRQYVRDACLSTLLNLLEENMPVVRVRAQRTTMRCQEAGCGFESDFDRDQLMVTCPKCGVTIDQDRRAAINLLTSTEVVLTTP